MNPPDLTSIIASLKAQTKKEALIELTGLFPDLDKKLIVRELMDRETLGSTAITSGIALPHTKSDTVNDILIAVGRSKAGIHWGARDGQPIHLICLMIAPEKASSAYLQTLAKISRILKNSSTFTLLHNAQGKDEISQILNDCFHSS